MRVPPQPPPTLQGAKPKAEIQRAYRERLKASRLSPADLADLHERFRVTLLKLELREQDVARLTARNAYLENELRRVEQHNTNILKEVITPNQAAPSVRSKTRVK
jgi:hypothetical protein